MFRSRRQSPSCESSRVCSWQYRNLASPFAEHDHATVEFLKFFVDEQREEEVLFKKIIDRIKLVGKGAQSMYYIDKEMEKFSTAKPANDTNAKA